MHYITFVELLAGTKGHGRLQASPAYLIISILILCGVCLGASQDVKAIDVDKHCRLSQIRPWNLQHAATHQALTVLDLTDKFKMIQ